MFCKSCGKQIDGDSKFCSFCGTKQWIDFEPNTSEISNQTSNIHQKLNSNEGNIKSSNSVKQLKYDPTYQTENDALTFGIILLVINLLFVFTGPLIFENLELNEQI